MKTCTNLIFTKNNEILIYGTTLIIIAFSIVGILKLEVENSFINYFDKLKIKISAYGQAGKIHTMP